MGNVLIVLRGKGIFCLHSDTLQLQPADPRPSIHRFFNDDSETDMSNRWEGKLKLLTCVINKKDHGQKEH
jgi:hypothetical protein